MCEVANIKNAQIKELCEEIIESQKREIDEMKVLLKESK
jgi:uncharacterized protein (DUF305 family)